MFSTNISKKELWRSVNLEIKRKVNAYQVFSVISALFDEILEDLKNGKEIKIFNFGTLYMYKTKPRKYFHLVHRKVMESTGKKMIKFELIRKVRKALC